MLIDRQKPNNGRIFNVMQMIGVPLVWLLIYLVWLRDPRPLSAVIAAIITILIHVLLRASTEETRSYEPHDLLRVLAGVVIVLAVGVTAQLTAMSPGVWRVFGAALMALVNWGAQERLPQKERWPYAYYRVWCVGAYALLGLIALIGLGEVGCGLSAFLSSIGIV